MNPLSILDWIWLKLVELFSSTHGFAALLGVLIGVFLTEALAHMLPPGMNAYAADRITRLVCFGASLCATLALDPTVRGAVLALLAGLAGPTLHGLFLRYVNARWPNLTPRALIDAPGDAPRPLLPKDGP